VLCKVGGSTTTVDSAATCSDIGGTVVPPKPPKPSGTHCRTVIGPPATGFGWADHDVARIAEAYMDDVLKNSKSGRRFLKALASIDRFVLDGVRKNPSLMGEVVLAWLTCIAFLDATDSPRGKTATFSNNAYRRLSRLGRGLAKTSGNERFHGELDYLRAEFKSWVNKTPDDVKHRYSEA
jgi:hypothetical protein